MMRTASGRGVSADASFDNVGLGAVRPSDFAV